MQTNTGATDCASARQMDVEDIKFVINYDYPNSSEDYVHRIGRTARSTNKGTAYTFFTPGNLKQARELIKVLQEASQAINPKLMQLVDHGRGGGGGGGRSRYRTIPTSNNPNMMYQDECNRRFRGKDTGRAGGSSNFRDRVGGRDRGNSSTFNGSNRNSYAGMGNQPSQYGYNQATYGAPATNYGASSYGGQDFNTSNYNAATNSTNNASGRNVPNTGQPQQPQQPLQPPPQQQQQQFGGAARPNAPQPLMSQQFAPPPPTTGMNYMGQSGMGQTSNYQYQPPPPPPPPRK